ncbi:helix-turn-helix domain-containing protein [uncultured Merdimonas sp.]|uniref:helix-turn-helix transcriptional regulator n=1 Tax=uncultured Merdimonas sp. TaxID=2023269 RepID=UPI00320B2D91
MANIQLASNLKTLRKRHHLTQTDLSRMLNVSRQAYSNYETGKRTPDLDSLIFLSRYYQVSLSMLVLGSVSGSIASSETMMEDTVPYLCSSDEKTGHSIYLSEQELDFILAFRSLSEENRQIVAGFLKSAAAPAD